jgi:hypothetical protein
MIPWPAHPEQADRTAATNDGPALDHRPHEDRPMTRELSTNFAPLLRLRRPQPHEVCHEHRSHHRQHRYCRLAISKRGRTCSIALA